MKRSRPVSNHSRMTDLSLLNVLTCHSSQACLGLMCLPNPWFDAMRKNYDGKPKHSLLRDYIGLSCHFLCSCWFSQLCRYHDCSVHHPTSSSAPTWSLRSATAQLPLLAQAILLWKESQCLDCRWDILGWFDKPNAITAITHPLLLPETGVKHHPQMVL